MTTRAPAPAQTVFPALGTTAALLVTDPSALLVATAALRAELTAVDLTCSRFRPDSELSRVNLGAGSSMTVSGYFAEALRAALRAARITDGAVDPTVGGAVIALGYDCTFASVRPDNAPRTSPAPRSSPSPAPSATQVSWKSRSAPPLTTVLDRAGGPTEPVQAILLGGSPAPGSRRSICTRPSPAAIWPRWAPRPVRACSSRSPTRPAD
ncbi:FAD:protein FMN transferase [Streptomyces guryensis]|uniref:FAD:protein FMN transferase n=1 Tax=Streptomyces guryensis TaxID=2886947 RepID=A0A9Q3Z9Z0_9ACTN|nr:FAD:protein FMN transferase [Streptomyces guryensis]MCD9874815.1 FAD:protein FMN transferase [Streptomyces guryensis]